MKKNNYPPLLFEAWSFDWFKDERESLISFVNDLGYEITTLGTSDYIAQHPGNSVKVKFAINSEGGVNMEKLV